MTIALVTLGFVLGRTMLARRDQDRVASARLPSEVSQRIRDFRRIKVEAGRTVWELTAREAEYLEEQGLVVVERPQVTFLGADGQRIEVRGREGRVNLDGADVEKIQLTGGIEVEVGAYLLRANDALWVREHDMILSPGPVSVTGAELTLDGSGMVVDLRNQPLQIGHDVRTVVRGRTEQGEDPGEAVPAGRDPLATAYRPEGRDVVGN